MSDKRTKWTGSVPKCDFCGETNMDEFVDGQTELDLLGLGLWGIMCMADFKRHGVGLGTGRGQKYKLEHGSYYVVEDE